MSNRQGFAIVPLLIIVAAVAVLVTAVVLVVTQPKTTAPATNTDAVACTADAKQCPDGSYVSRVPPSCEFAACPATNTNSGANTNTAADATEGWKTYTNVNVGYSIQYPPKWSVEEAETVKIVSDEVWSVQSQAPGSPRYLIFIQAIKNPNDEVDKLQGRKTVMVNGVAADQGLIIGIPHERVTVLQRGATAVRISWSGRTDETGAEIEYQILSTFQFTDQTAATKDWKKYKNNKYSFQMLHPKEWAESGTEIASTDGKTINLPSLGFYPSGQVYGGDGDITVQFRVYPQVTATLAAWFSENIELTQAKKEAAINGPCAGTATLSDISNTASDTTVASLEAKVQYIKYTKPGYCEGPASTSRGYYMKKGSSVYEIIASAPTGMQSEASLQTFDQAIATFQFTK